MINPKIPFILMLAVNFHFLNAQYIDESFGEIGFVVTDFHNQIDETTAGTFDYLNRSISIGHVQSSTSTYTGIVRIKSNGNYDSTFANIGRAEFPQINLSNAVATYPDGKIVIGGTMGDDNGNTVFALFRVNEDGSEDDNFGVNGLVIHAISNAYVEQITSLAVQSDGKIIAGGYMSGDNSSLAVLVRFNVDGSFDDTFSTTGMNLSAVPAQSAIVTKIIVGSDDSMALLVHLETNTQQNGLVIRLDENGNYLPAFGVNGVINLLEAGYEINPSGISLLADGSIEVTGTFYTTQSNGCKILLLPNGYPDIAYGTNGAATIIGTTSIEAIDSHLQTDGKTIVLAYGPELLLVRLNVNGSIDTSFGDSGFWYPNLSGNTEQGIVAKIFPNEKMIIIGSIVLSAEDIDYMTTCIQLDIEDDVNEIAQLDFTVYPNPNGGKFRIVHPISSNSLLQLIDISGKIVYQLNITEYQIADEIEVPKDIQTGLYQLNLVTNKGNFTSRLFINK